MPAFVAQDRGRIEGLAVEVDIAIDGRAFDRAALRLRGLGVLARLGRQGLHRVERLDLHVLGQRLADLLDGLLDGSFRRLRAAELIGGFGRRRRAPVLAAGGLAQQACVDGFVEDLRQGVERRAELVGKRGQIGLGERALAVEVAGQGLLCRDFFRRRLGRLRCVRGDICRRCRGCRGCRVLSRDVA